jgi:pyridoxamine 5'-phosphate oxidase
LRGARASGNLLRVDISALRQDYRSGELRRASLDPNPICQFQKWFAEASTCEGIREPNAMTLATANATGEVSARIVLLKGCDAEGFRFFTNYESRKGAHIAENSQVSLLFFWAPLERQAIICGRAEKNSREESETYFQQRPLASRLGAWASQQSSPIESRAELEARYAELEKTYADGRVPLPPTWGGYLVRPTTVEFWQGRTSRLHDRFRYTRETNGSWRIERLAP